VPSGKDDKEHVEVKSLDELHDWLANNHDRPGSIWLIRYKKRVPEHYVPWEEMVRELLCWGWIDGQVKRIDDDRLKQLISPRKKGSHWSAINKRHLEALEAAGRLQPAGLEAIARAKTDGSWSFLDDIEALVVPADLQEALDADPKVAATWNDYPASEKKAALFALKSAKRVATRQKRLAKIVDRAAKGERAFT